MADFHEDEGMPNMTRPVFIPAIDMMAHTRRFLSTYDEYQIDFDQTHRDIVALLLAPERRQPPQNPEIAQLLGSLLGGSVEEENERLLPPNAARTAAHAPCCRRIA